MFANKFTINVSTVTSGTTATTVNIPINMDFQMVDQNELVKRVFVDVETENAINPIIDYDKVRFLPLDLSGNHIDKVIYIINSGTTYFDIGFTNDDIKFERNNFKQSFLDLNFYDTDNPFTQNLVTYMTLYAEIKPSDLLPDTATQIAAFGYVYGIPGQPKPANQIPVTFVLENPILNPRGFSEGYHLYDYKDELVIGQNKYLYMRATFKNAKTGKSDNMMVKNTALSIDTLIHELYTRYKLVRNATGYYYEIDDTYQGNANQIGNPNNVAYTYNPTQNSVTINLYTIKAL